MTDIATPEFRLVSEIDAKQPTTWSNSVFLTIDLDWCSDEVLAQTMELVQNAGVKATWFATHPSQLLDEIRAQGHEIGIHPNFNSLLDGTGKGGRDSADIVLDRLLDHFEYSKSLRSHSLAQSEKLLDLFASRGITHVCNTFIPLSSGIASPPFAMWDGITVVPHSWQDNVALRLGEDSPSFGLLRDGFVVANFHPIHITLNTDTLERYESTRAHHKDIKALSEHINHGSGVRNDFIKLLQAKRKF